MKKHMLAAFSVLGIVFYAFPQCTKDIECKGDRVCVNGECVDKQAGDEAPSRDKFAGIHLGTGVSVGGGFSIKSVNPNPAIGDGAFMAALRVSALFRRFELQAEFSPYSFIPLTSGPAGFSVTTTVGGYLPMGSVACWPLRVGIGFANINGRGYFQTRADLIGVAVRLKKCLIELTLPTYRFLTDFDTRYIYAFSFNLGFSWIF